jgi:hypothetical protein
MPSIESIASLAAAMEGEIACLEAYVEGQKAFAASLRNRDWRSLQDSMAALEIVTRRLAKIEEVRAEAEASLRDDARCSEEGFYRLVLRVTEPERTMLTDVYRRLKIAAMRARFENNATGSLAEESRDLLGAVLEELFPEKRGKIYGRSGRALPAGHDSLVLNTAL